MADTFPAKPARIPADMRGGDWVKTATADQLRAFVVMARDVFAAVEAGAYETLPPMTEAPYVPAARVTIPERAAHARSRRRGGEVIRARHGVIPAGLGGAVLAQMRKARGISERKAAALVGISRSMLCSIERDERAAGRTRVRLVKAYRAAGDMHKRCIYCRALVTRANANTLTCGAESCSQRLRRRWDEKARERKNAGRTIRPRRRPITAGLMLTAQLADWRVAL